MNTDEKQAEQRRLYRMLVEAELKEAAWILRDIFPHLPPYEIEHALVEAHKK